MKIYQKITASIVLLLLSISLHANDMETVKAFYSQLLSQPTRTDLDATAAQVVTENWVSIPTPRGGPDREGLVKSLVGFGETIPDLSWEPQEILQDGNRFIVRSIAKGTPVKPFFGVEPTGKSFEIMSIDIHTVEDGLIAQSYHIEQWVQAIRQLKTE